MRVLVVEDDARLATTLRRLVVLHGWDAVVVHSAEDAIEAFAARDQFDIAIVDGNLPGIDGLELCRRLRQAGDDLPLLMLTARAGIEDRVAGLDAGADDYLTKPFANEELVARLRALTRRERARQDSHAGPASHAASGELLRFGDLQLDVDRMVAMRGERSIDLKRTELELLALLMRHPRVVIRRSVMLRDVWGHERGPESNTLEVHIGALRRKLEAAAEPRLIHTVRGVGYVLREPPQ